MKSILFLFLFSFAGLSIHAQMNRQFFEFEHEQVTLHGELNIPQDVPVKGIVLILHGSGRTNAIEQQWHQDVRYTLYKAGYAVYMWDKKGCGKSDGTFNYNQTASNSAEEALAAIQELQKQNISGADAIGLWGISRAGWIAPLVINSSEDILFWISVSGVDEKESFGYLLKENLNIEGIPDDSIAVIVDEWHEGNTLTHTGADFETYLDATQNLRQNAFMNRFNPQNITRTGYESYQSWFKTQAFDYESRLQVYVEDFEELLNSVDVPVLALFGDLDKHVDWRKTKFLYENTLDLHTSYSSIVFSSCNHNMFKSYTGGFYEFEDNQLPWNRCDGFLESISDWGKHPRIDSILIFKTELLFSLPF